MTFLYQGSCEKGSLGLCCIRGCSGIRLGLEFTMTAIAVQSGLSGLELRGLGFKELGFKVQGLGFRV